MGGRARPRLAGYAARNMVPVHNRPQPIPMAHFYRGGEGVLHH